MIFVIYGHGVCTSYETIDLILVFIMSKSILCIIEIWNVNNY